MTKDAQIATLMHPAPLHASPQAPQVIKVWWVHPYYTTIMIWARGRRWSPILGLHQDKGSSLQIGTPGRPTICNDLV
jgi:hypothetical protein